MSIAVQIRGHIFVDGCWVQNNNGRYFHCFHPSCPLAVILSFHGEGVQRRPSVERVVFSKHCHALHGISRKEVKKILQAELKSIERRDPGSEVLEEKHDRWQAQAKDQGQEMIDELDHQDRFDDHVLKHPDATGSKLRKFTGKKRSKKAASMARLRAPKTQLPHKHHRARGDGRPPPPGK